MQKHLLLRTALFFGLLSFGLGAKGQYVLIPDANFRQALINLGYGSCFDGTQTMLDTTCGLVVNATSLDVHYSSIHSIEGVQYFDGLHNLDCSGNNLGSLPTLPDSLTYLNCYYCFLSGLPPLPNSLVNLNCEGNQITVLPSLPDALTHLNCTDNFLSVLPSLPNSLINLGCNLNPLSCLPWLPDNLEQVFASSTGITCIPNLPANSNFVYHPDPWPPFCNGSNGLICDTTLYCDSSGLAAITVLHGWPGFFPSDVTPVYAHIGSACAGGTSGTVMISIDGPVTYVAPLANALTPVVNGDTLTYFISDFGQVNPVGAFNFIVHTDTNAQIGQWVCFALDVIPNGGDSNTANNHVENCFAVGNSYDPNMKEVSPIGSLAYPADGQRLTYTIHFQNTGTAAAQNIEVRDTLDASLDTSTFEVLAHSHGMQTFVTGNALRFSFPNINLPDSTSDEPNSHGYVQYRIKVNNGLPNGTSISNNASIYFDFNAPVVTNTVTNNICSATASNAQASICPNATYNFFGTQLSSAGTYTHTLQNANGCDSVITLQLQVLNNSASNTQASICPNTTYDFFGTPLSSPGSYSHTLQNATGCDSVITLALSVLDNSASTTQATICEGELYAFNQQEYFQSGTYNATLQNAVGCDSVATLLLTVEQHSSASITETIAQGNSYDFNGTLLSAAGTYTDTLVNALGCDSVVTLTLDVINGLDASIPIAIGTSMTAFTLTPNPAHDAVNVHVADVLVGSEVMVSDVLGQVVMKERLLSQYSILNTHILPSGVYIVRIGTVAKRLVIQ